MAFQYLLAVYGEAEHPFSSLSVDGLGCVRLEDWLAWLEKEFASHERQAVDLAGLGRRWLQGLLLQLRESIHLSLVILVL